MTIAAAGSPAVTFGDGRRPESRTQVQLAEFDGPLGLLLSLIEARQLDVLTVPLGALAEAYLDALGRLEADRLGNVSSFVAIASQLILIKSRAMLPRRPEATDATDATDDEIDPEAELRARLIVYRAHRDAGRAPPPATTTRTADHHATRSGTAPHGGSPTPPPRPLVLLQAPQLLADRRRHLDVHII
jgi:segregation and condensation protein A